MKTIITLILALFSQLALANHWKHNIQNVEGLSLRLSYTTAFSPATYGSEGGDRAGILYIDVYSQNALNAEEVEIFEVTRDNRLNKVTTIKLKEDNSRHFYGKMNDAGTYADIIWYSRTYLYRIVIDGKLIEKKFRL